MVFDDLNAQVKREEIENIAGKYGVLGQNGSGRKLLETCVWSWGWWWGIVFLKSGRKVSPHGGGG